MRTARKLRALEGGAGPKTTGARDYEGKYQVIFDQASDAILTLLPNGKVDAMNRAAEDMTGFMKDELVGASVEDLAPKGQRLPNRAKALSAEFFKTAGTYEDVAIARKDGYIRLVDLNVSHLSGRGTRLAMVLLRDLTEKKQMERELITKHSELRNAYYQLEKKNAEAQAMQETLVQAGKLAALGELAAGIAHELNQPLQGIRGYAQELQALVGAGSSPGGASGGRESAGETSAALKEIISNADKMAAIIDYLRAFTRKSVEKHELVDVHHAIEEALKMLSRQFQSRGIRVERRFSENLPKVYANPLQLEQVFINLATNARDAIEETGRGRGTVTVTTRVAGNFVEIEFRDDGAGMSDRTKSKAFNPFFTTKEVGKGMGLGLSLSYGVISKLHGSMVVESEFGKGAAFLIRLPRDFRELA